MMMAPGAELILLHTKEQSEEDHMGKGLWETEGVSMYSSGTNLQSP
jgi:hypothetical protein